MAVEIESLSGLKRKMTISVPTEAVTNEFDLRLKKLAGKVKIDGFRPGKVPLKVVKQRFSHSVMSEVAQELIQKSLYDALLEHDLSPVAAPDIQPEHMSPGLGFQYHATFEILPKFEIKDLDGQEVTLVSAEVEDADVDKTIETLREKNKVWHEVARAASQHDKVILDFEGFLNDEPFAGGKAENFEVILGDKAMIPGFEDGLIGLKADEEKNIDLTFPTEYSHVDLAGKATRFHVTVKKVMEASLPEVNEEFAKLFHVDEGGVPALRSDIKENMNRELTRRVSSLNRETIFDAMLAINQFEVPEALIEKEIAHLKHEMYHQIYGNEHREDEQIPDFPKSLFEEKAIRRVQLGLLFSDYVKKYDIKVDASRVDAMIDVFASAYEHPEEVRAWYHGRKERLDDIEALVMEEMIADQIVLTAKVLPKAVSYSDVMHPPQADKTEEASSHDEER